MMMGLVNCACMYRFKFHSYLFFITAPNYQKKKIKIISKKYCIYGCSGFCTKKKIKKIEKKINKPGYKIFFRTDIKKKKKIGM